MILVGFLIQTPNRENSFRILRKIDHILYDEPPILDTPLLVKKKPKTTDPILWGMFVLVFTGLLIVDLFRIPVSVNSSYKYAPEQTLWQKMSPQEDQRLKELQAHCHHIYVANGRVFYYCPICRTKLTRATAPLWQI